MHLLVLSAFRLDIARRGREVQSGLNAPSGAQCFPTEHRHGLRGPLKQRSQCTFWCSVLSDVKPANEFGTAVAFQCTFWCSVLSDTAARRPVPRRCPAFQCTFWCSVLSDREGAVQCNPPKPWFQCTFWCSVLSDFAVFAGLVAPVLVSMHLLVLSAFRR